MSEYQHTHTDETMQLDPEIGGRSEEEEKDNDEENRCQRQKISRQCIICLLMITILMIILAYFLFEGYKKPTPIQTEEKYNFTEDIFYPDFVDPSDLNARVIGGGSNHHKTCDDIKYGCCEIFTECKPKNGFIDYQPLTLSFYRIEPHDRIKSNCPSLDTLVHLWNTHYQTKPENKSAPIIPCENTEFGCCPSINTGCDFSLHNQYPDNNQQTVDYYLNHKSRKHTSKITKDDAEGSNCLGHVFTNYPLLDLIYAYEYNYPDPDDSSGIWALGLVLGTLACCWGSSQ